MRECGEEPKRLVVPYRLWISAFKEINNIQSVYVSLGPTTKTKFDRFILDGVEVRIE
jgi:hypothetical protein